MNVVMSMVMVFLGGGFGSVLRFGLSNLSHLICTEIWPATCLVNIIGSLTYVFLASKYPNMPPQYHQFLKAGVLGGLTTFSTFSYEIFSFIQKGQILTAVMIFSLNVLFGIAVGVWIFGHKLI